MTREQAHILLIYEALRLGDPQQAAKLLADAMMIGATSLESLLGAHVPADQESLSPDEVPNAVKDIREARKRKEGNGHGKE